MNGFKGFNLNKTKLFCKDFEYEVGKTYEIPKDKLKLCYSGFHFCDNIKDVNMFYPFYNYPFHRFCFITAFGDGDIQTHELVRNKYCCSKIRIDKLLNGIIDGYYFENGKYISNNISKAEKTNTDNGYIISDYGKTHYYNFKKKLHRIDGPAVENTQEGYTEWYKDGKLHREDGPAYQDDEGVKEWYKDGKLHREDGPAIEYENGTVKWYKNNNLHREDGPAIEYKDGYKEWYENDVLIKIKNIPDTIGKKVEHSKNGNKYFLTLV